MDRSETFIILGVDTVCRQGKIDKCKQVIGFSENESNKFNPILGGNQP